MTRAIMGSGEQQKLQRLAELEVRIKDLDVGVRGLLFSEKMEIRDRRFLIYNSASKGHCSVMHNLDSQL